MGPLASPVLNGSSILSVGCPLHSAVSIFNYFAYLNWLDGACPSVHVCLVRLIGHWFDVHISDCILCHLQSEAKTFLPILNFWPGLVS